jgi:hypothetical protein
MYDIKKNRPVCSGQFIDERVEEKMAQNESNLNELLEDIRQIKNAIKQNSYTLREMIYQRRFILAVITAGITATLIPLLSYFFLQRHGDYQAIPLMIRWLLIAGIGLGFGLTTFWKGSAFFQVAPHSPQTSLLKIYIRLLSRQALILYPILFGIMFFFIIFFMKRQSYHLLVPTIAIGLGVCFSTNGAFISLMEFFLFGIYICILGTLSVPFIIANPRASLIWAAGIFGLGMLLFGIYLLFFSRPSKEH